MSEQLVQLERPAPRSERTSTTSSITVRDMVVAADIGVHAHELGQPQPLTVSVTLTVGPPRSDCIEDTLDYNAIVALVEALAGQRIGLIETFARRLACDCLNLEGVRSADVTVEKPQALQNGVASTRLVLNAG